VRHGAHETEGNELSDTDYELGSLETANAIVAFLRRAGHGAAANDVLVAWENDTLVEHVPVIVLEAVPSRETAKAQGFTGDQCTNCNSMRMQISGHCAVCADCGTTTGCS
jgi:hypothetical protein